VVASQLQIQSQLTCPSCWSGLKPEQLLWVSAHPELRGDDILGDDAPRRFLPTRFDVEGFALDAEGMRCQSLACPKCHLTIPRILVDYKPLFLSVLGAPSSGKSYFLASMIWQTRQRLRSFHVDFADADPVANQILSGYEQKLFLAEDGNAFVAISKTEPDGELYQAVDYGGHQEIYPRPFVFAMQPGRNHVRRSQFTDVRVHSRALCLYDNAGEHFQPRPEAELSPATEHLALSEALLFVFDPIQHNRFRQLCREFSHDPQLDAEFQCFRQDEILLEAAKRIRLKANLAQHQPFDRPLIIVVNKWDVWEPLMKGVDLRTLDPFRRTRDGEIAVDWTILRQVSDRTRGVIERYAPEVVSACDSFCRDVTYIPVTPQGCSPEQVPGATQRLLGVRPGKISPIWAEVPLLYAISRTRSILIPGGESAPAAATSSSPPMTARAAELEGDER
jgi:hypothetical protein